MSDAFTQALDRLSRISGVRGALIVEADAGLPVVSELQTDVDGGAVAALAASLYRRTGKATDTADFGGLRTMQLEADAGHVVVAGAGELLIVVITERSAQLGMLRLEMHRAAEALL
jgi:predicted regulator of Ras-like GTPase activity (Roadblock/LC7/MglB family)